MKALKKQEAGSILIAAALLIVVLISFVALGLDAGLWFVVRAELSKAVDASALEAAKNLSNPHVGALTLAGEFAAENFPDGYLATSTSGSGGVGFTAQLVGTDRVQVDGRAGATPILAQVVGVSRIPISSVGVAQKRPVEIMMLLDRSRSMIGGPFADLKTAAKSFLDFFQDTQAQDKVGLISFATSVIADRPLGTNYVTPMKAAIDAMESDGGTNIEDGLDQMDGPNGFTNQNGVPSDRRVQQFLVVFTDGRPTGFRGTFKNKGKVYDAVACVTQNCEEGDGGETYNNLCETSQETWLGIDPRGTGDGIHNATCNSGKASTRWYIFDTHPVPGYPANATCIQDPPLYEHICDLASTLALQHAQELKAEGVTIYAIGLGKANSQFLGQLASSPNLVYYAPTSDQLQAIFQRIAQEIKLRLVR